MPPHDGSLSGRPGAGRGCGGQQGADGARIIALAPGSEALPAIEKLSVRLWCRRETEASWIAAAAAKIVRRKPDGDIGEAIRAAAKKLGVAVQTDDEIAVEAMTVAATIDSKCE